MGNKLRNWASHRRSLILIVGVLVAIGVLAIVAVSTVGHKEEGEKMVDRTNPVLVDSAASGQTAARGSEAGFGTQGAGEGKDELLFIRMSPGQAQPQAVEPTSVTTGEPLTDEEIERILARLPELAGEPEDQADFKLPEELLPPPRPGETVEEPFPPLPPELPPPDQVAAGPLEVLRFGPEGEIPLAPFVNVTFNQPMVPLATLGALAAEEVPVRLEPALPGAWRWLGTKTLSFEYDSAAIDRLPMATEYGVTGPAGTESATGGVLAEAVRWSFSTPPPRMISSYPSADAQPLEPVFVVAFDQRVDPQAVLDTIQVTAAGERSRSGWRASEVDMDTGARWVAEPRGRTLAGVCGRRAAADRCIESVNIGPGTRLRDCCHQSGTGHGFHTHAPLAIERHEWPGLAMNARR
jgi:hypothetical protein